MIASHPALWWLLQFLSTLWVLTLVFLFWSGVKPFGKFSTKWYDRVIRAGGAGIILAMMLVGLVLYMRGLS